MKRNFRPHSKLSLSSSCYHYRSTQVTRLRIAADLISFGGWRSGKPIDLLPEETNQTQHDLLSECTAPYVPSEKFLEVRTMALYSFAPVALTFIKELRTALERENNRPIVAAFAANYITTGDDTNAPTNTVDNNKGAFSPLVPLIIDALLIAHNIGLNEATERLCFDALLNNIRYFLDSRSPELSGITYSRCVESV